MFELIYTSRSTGSLKRPAIEELLEQSRLNNVAHDITGFLTYNGSEFLQILEGTEQGVNLIFDRIKADGRHLNIAVYHQGHIKRRNFGDWQMAFAYTNTENQYLWDNYSALVDATSSKLNSLGSRIFRLLLKIDPSTQLSEQSLRN